MSESRGVITAATARKLSSSMGLSLEQLMIQLLDVFRELALVPVSGFSVGAVGLGASGDLYPGVNLEFPGRSLMYCVHAEQAAVMNALLRGESSLSMLAVSAAPCGFCRQFLHELNSAPELRMLLPQGKSRLLSDFLPDAFGPRDLGNPERLMASTRRELVVDEDAERNGSEVSEPLLAAALDAAQTAYAPYTGSHAGAAVRIESGHIYSGTYVENAAFNPAISPMASALATLRVAGGDFADIREALLVETSSGISQRGVSVSVLSSVSSVELAVVRAK